MANLGPYQVGDFVLLNIPIEGRVLFGNNMSHEQPEWKSFQVADQQVFRISEVELAPSNLYTSVGTGPGGTNTQNLYMYTLQIMQYENRTRDADVRTTRIFSGVPHKSLSKEKGVWKAFDSVLKAGDVAFMGETLERQQSDANGKPETDRILAKQKVEICDAPTTKQGKPNVFARITNAFYACRFLNVEKYTDYYWKASPKVFLRDILRRVDAQGNAL